MRLAISVVVLLGFGGGRARADGATGTFSVGAGYNPDAGFVGAAEVAQDDLFHSGQRLALSAELSSLEERFAIDHVIRNVANTGLELSSQLLYDNRKLPGFTREGIGGSVGLGYHVSRTTRVFVKYRVERVATSLLDPLATARATMPGEAPPSGDATIAALGAGVSYDTRDGAIPRHGTCLELFAETADPTLGSSAAVQRFTGRYEHAEPLGPLTLRFSGHGELVTTPDVAGVPRSERLYHAGNADVRGYAIDPFDRGSNAVAVGHLELEAPVWRRAGLAVAGFIDAGISREQHPTFGGVANVVRRSVGGSVIWRSPIGAMRLDLAVPLDGTDRHPRIMFWLPGAAL